MQTLQTLTFIKKEVPSWAAGTVAVPGGSVFRVSPGWTRADYAGMIKSRVSAFRMSYAVTPGLYAIGDPAGDSDVFVTANYKLTFDVLRRELKGMNAWILALDTKGINVWCAAGKGTFGADELVTRVREARLDAVVSHRRLILPQLGAVGVNAADVQKRTGFRVVFGPVQARDIRAYVQAGYKKTKEMSTITFSLLDRLVLTPMEINPLMKKYRWFAAGTLVAFGLQPSGVLFREAWSNGWPFLALGFLTILAGTLITPLLLPFIPFRSFAIKGWLVGIATILPALRGLGIPDRPGGVFLSLASVLLFPALASYIALQFTGATTYTGMSGVNKELKTGIPLYIGAGVLSLVLLLLFKLTEWRVL